MKPQCATRLLISTLLSATLFTAAPGNAQEGDQMDCRQVPDAEWMLCQTYNQLVKNTRQIFNVQNVLENGLTAAQLSAIESGVSELSPPKTTRKIFPSNLEKIERELNRVEQATYFGRKGQVRTVWIRDGNLEDHENLLHGLQSGWIVLSEADEFDFSFEPTYASPGRILNLFGPYPLKP